MAHGGEIKRILEAVKKKIASPALNLIPVLKSLSKYRAYIEVVEFLHQCCKVALETKEKTDHWRKMQISFMSNKGKKSVNSFLPVDYAI